ncbi:MAG: hypothetical protein LJE62_12840 [Silicimonas sp.]|nr:hypothetical protein [Silicimonas sp.]
METRWGLDLDMSAVRLMRRDGVEWVEHAVEKIDSPDIEDRLQALISPIEAGESVLLFLPRDQILYTVVELDAAQEPVAQIERAMDGRTPYELEDLAIDWEADDGNTVRVAAIARDTLDEAADFASMRDLPIAGYSTLFSGEDFPRLPRFDGPSLGDTPDSDTAGKAVSFTTARVPSRPPAGAIAAASMAAGAKARFTPKPTASELAHLKPSEPVVAVDETTPVVQVKEPLLPLDPGIPISAPNAPPRIRTDIAAASVSGHAASLSPPGSSVRIRKKSARVSTLAVFAAALLVTIGIAALVWNFLPMRPSKSTEAPIETGSVPSEIVRETEAREQAPTSQPQAEIAATEPEVPDIAASEPEVPEVAPTKPQEPEIVAAAPPEPETPALSDEPPAATTLITTLAVPSDPASPAPQPAPPTVPARATLPAPPTTISVSGNSTPEVDAEPPVPATPRALARIQTTAPFLGPEPDTDETVDEFQMSAFEVPDPGTDAVALPNSILLLTDAPPVLSKTTLATLESDIEAEPQAPIPGAVEQALADALAGPGGLIPTELARGLPDRAPAPRPGQFTAMIERQQFGGRTRGELARLRPPPRPESEQSIAEEIAETEPSDLAVASSRTPRARPEGIAALVAAARVQQEAARVTASAAVQPPDTSGAIEAALQDDDEPENRLPQNARLNIPTSASVARTATIENAIRLNRINLVGVYGAPSDRRALIRLSSGRYVKVKVGDRVDGGTVAQITDSELYYRKGNRTLSLSVPKG